MKSYQDLKVQKSLRDEKKSNLKKYSELIIGSNSIWELMKYELVVTFVGWLPGAIGLLLRSKLYPLILGEVGKNVIFGRNIALRHPQKITIGNNVMIDDNTLLDAKGLNNSGITLSDGVFIGRNCILYCKNGNIHLEENVNIGHNCTIFSSNNVIMHKNTLVSAYCYILSGGEYDYLSEEAMIDQGGGDSVGDLEIGSNCWLGAKVVVTDGSSIGDHSVIGAGAVVTKPLPANSLSIGMPAKVIKKINEKLPTEK
ncbi:MAG: acyltransferase [Bacteroidetes bacterium]|nr:acyltransferase [Bacteroidota bacterium]